MPNKNSVMALDKNCASLIPSLKHFLDVVVKDLKQKLSMDRKFANCLKIKPWYHNLVESATWRSFISVIMEFLGKTKASMPRSGEMNAYKLPRFRSKIGHQNLLPV